MNWTPTLFADLILETKDGEWGESYQRSGYQLCEIIRGTDFSDLNSPNRELPLRWIADQFIERKQLMTGDILIETAGGTAKQSTGRTALITFKILQKSKGIPLLCSSFARHLRVDKDKCNPVYLYYLLQTLYRAGYMGVFNLQHTGISRFQFTAFKNKTVLMMPPLAEQQKIAAILIAYDDLIANNQRRITLLESMAEEIYREWFVRMRFPGYSSCTFIKGRPDCWAKGRLEEISTFTMGQSPSSEFYNSNGDGLPFHQGVGTYGPRYPKHEVFCSQFGRRAKAGDILFSVRAPVGRLNIADVDLTIGRGLAALRHKQGKNSYLFYLLRVSFANEDIIGNGSIFNSVGKDELANFPIYKPDMSLVERFEKIVQPIDAEIYSLYSIDLFINRLVHQ